MQILVFILYHHIRQKCVLEKRHINASFSMLSVSSINMHVPVLCSFSLCPCYLHGISTYFIHNINLEYKMPIPRKQKYTQKNDKYNYYYTTPLVNLANVWGTCFSIRYYTTSFFFFFGAVNSSNIKTYRLMRKIQFQ